MRRQCQIILYKSYDIFVHLQNVKTSVGQFENGGFVRKGSQFSFLLTKFKSSQTDNCTTFSAHNLRIIKGSRHVQEDGMQFTLYYPGDMISSMFCSRSDARKL